MLSNTNVSSGPYLTNGVTTAFPVTFKFRANSELAVYRTNLTTFDVAILILDSDYTVTGSGVDAGGVVTMTTVLATGFSVTILRNLSLTQLVQLVNQATFYPAVIEGEFDLLVMLIQMISERLGRVVVNPIGTTAFTFDDLVDAILARIVVLSSIYEVTRTMPGAAQANIVFGAHTLDAGSWLERVELDASSGVPVGVAINFQVKINGTLNATVFTLPAGTAYVQTSLGASHISLDSGDKVEWIFTQVGVGADPGLYVTAAIQFIRK